MQRGMEEILLCAAQALMTTFLNITRRHPITPMIKTNSMKWSNFPSNQLIITQRRIRGLPSK